MGGGINFMSGIASAAGKLLGIGSSDNNDMMGTLEQLAMKGLTSKVEGTISGRQQLAFMDKAYPDTSGAARLSAGGGGSGTGPIASDQMKMKKLELENAKEIALLNNKAGIRIAGINQGYGTDKLNKEEGRENWQGKVNTIIANLDADTKKKIIETTRSLEDARLTKNRADIEEKENEWWATLKIVNVGKTLMNAIAGVIGLKALTKVKGKTSTKGKITKPTKKERENFRSIIKKNEKRFKERKKQRQGE